MTITEVAEDDRGHTCTDTDAGETVSADLAEHTLHAAAGTFLERVTKPSTVDDSVFSHGIDEQ